MSVCFLIMCFQSLKMINGTYIYGGAFMKAKVNKDMCIGCGACTGICPNVFVIEDDGKAGVVSETIDAGDEDSVNEAVAGCPVAAIEAE